MSPQREAIPPEPESTKLWFKLISDLLGAPPPSSFSHELIILPDQSVPLFASHSKAWGWGLDGWHFSYDLFRKLVLTFSA